MSRGPLTDPARTNDELLRQRARELARPAPAPRDDLVEVLGFAVADQRYVVALGDVVEVVPVSPMARVPHAPPQLLGLAMLRGTLLAVFELGRPVAQRAIAPWMLVLGDGPDRLAIAVDEISGTDRLDPQQLLDAGEWNVGPVTALTGDGAGLLDVGSLLASDRYSIEPAAASPGSDHP